ncbi:MAG: UDP-glucose/GDP-mannose dehydrogenase family protein [Calditrichaceae bacterium]|nr:UDP-glucose/GDP-mannose dehydrogenase family protein [Calditrichaceae bacterium]MBN2707459.1 UDP-glucose/GDP-mannose dehydrogenase family protein [Calditrichaceae bacterium]RQV94026.1 MAG: UDP-glucose/GDP-mannose dehydrogenase family protein [Calditrichota bacterium]
MHVAVVGTGYVGLVAGACFADTGNDVICVDVDKKKIEMLNNGQVPIYEPGLTEILSRNITQERITFTTDIKEAIKKSQIILIAVGTPPDEDGSADLQYVLAVAGDIGKYMNDFKVVVDKSTVPVGTADKVKAEIKKHTQLDFAVVSNPEFLKEGAAIEDFMKPDRVIIGTDDEKAAEIMKNLYAPFVRTGKPIIVMDIKSAELTKYAANSILATKISFMNEIANLCEQVGANVEMVRKGIGSDRRIGPYFIFPGAGYGGSCFPKDVKAIIKTAEDYDISMEVLKAVERVNENQKTVLMKHIHEHFGDDLNELVFAVWGLAFKPNTDDMREAPSIAMINALLGAGAKVYAHDPEALKEAQWRFGDKINNGITLFKKRYDAIENADALVIMTEWNAFREPDFLLIKESLNHPVIFDGRNLYDPERMKKLGIKYYSIGRP